MRLQLLFVAVFVLLMLPGCSASATGPVVLPGPTRPAQNKLQFRTFTSQEHGFSILMPGKPIPATNKAPSNLGELTFKSFNVDTYAPMGVWKVSLVDYPSGTVTAENQETLLDAGIKGAAEAAKGKLINPSKITLEKEHSGRSFQINAPDYGGFVHARNYLVGDRLYQIMVVGEKKVTLSPEATQFLDSFTLTK